jgi:ABC-2 type transport system permease protein
MHKILIVMRHEFLGIVMKPTFWISLVGLPLFMGVVMGISLFAGTAATAATLADRQNRSVEQGYVDHSGIIKTVPADTTLLAFPNEAAARAALTERKITGFFVVAADYVDTGNVTFISENFSPLESPTGTFERVLKLNLLGGDTAALQRADMSVVVQREESLAPREAPGASDAGLGFPILPMFAGILFMVVMISASSYLMQTVSTEKETRVMEVLMSSVTPTQLLAGKIAGLGLVGFIQLALWLLSALSALNSIPSAAALGTVSSGAVIVAVIYFVLGYFIYASLMAGLGALMPGTREAAQYTFFILLPLIIPMYLNTAIVLEPNGPLAVALSLIPLTAPVVMVMRVVATDVPPIQIVIGIVLLAATVVLFVVLVSRLFRAQALLSGSKPTLKQVVQALR